MKIKEIIEALEAFAPLDYQEAYDNSGLIIGNPDAKIDSALLTIDVTPDVVDEAIKNKNGIIIAHHPIIFSGLKKITGKSFVEKAIIKAIKNDIGIYAGHTNFDSVTGGVSSEICSRLNLNNCRILSPVNGKLKKLVTFVPIDNAQEVRLAIFQAGAGQIGDYDQCSYNLEGEGTFRASESANPYVGEKNEIHLEKEIRVETIFPSHLEAAIINSLISAHPYEEVAYDIYPLDNSLNTVGLGMIGELDNECEEVEFMNQLKSVFNTKVIRHTALRGKAIKKVAVCGGSGSSLLKRAISAGSDIFVSGDFKYHQFFDAENRILIADVGHYETEQFTKDIFYRILSKKFPKFALHFSKINTNPINYL